MDVCVQAGLELLVRGEPAAGVELVLEVAEHLLGRGVVDAVALPAHGLAGVYSGCIPCGCCRGACLNPTGVLGYPVRRFV